MENEVIETKIKKLEIKRRIISERGKKKEKNGRYFEARTKRDMAVGRRGGREERKHSLSRHNKPGAFRARWGGVFLNFCPFSPSREGVGNKYEDDHLLVPP